VSHRNAPLTIEGRRRLVERCRTRPIAHVAAEHLAADHPHRGVVLAALGEAFRFRFELTGAPGDADAAVAFGERAVAVMPAHDPQRGTALGKLAQNHVARFEAAGEPADLDSAVGYYERALAESTPAPELLARLAHTHRRRFWLGGAPSDVDAQIGYAEHGLAVAGAGNPYRPFLYDLVATGHELRYERARDAADLDAAIRYREAAADGGWTEPAMRARNLSNLSFDYLDRFGVTGDPADV
jgi:hypothetical protein